VTPPRNRRDPRPAGFLFTIRYRQRSPSLPDDDQAQRRFDLAVARELVDDCC
jgi:hypothetical protein